MISVKFYLDINRYIIDGQRTKWHRNIAENFNRLSRVHERYRQTTDRQTDGRSHIANVNSTESSYLHAL